MHLFSIASSQRGRGKLTDGDSLYPNDVMDLFLASGELFSLYIDHFALYSRTYDIALFRRCGYLFSLSFSLIII